MVLLISILLGSVFVLWLYNKSHLTALGFRPTNQRMVDFTFGFVSSSFAATLGLLAVAMITHATLSLNENFTLTMFFESVYWMLKSVVSEELIFRGALLYIAIKRLGVHQACILSSVAFGIYHWFSYDAMGQISQMMYIFLLTGAGGLMFAYSFAITKSMYLPIALHLGWNIISVVVFSQGPLGDQVLIASGGQPLGLWTIAFFIYQVGVLPLVAFLYLRKKVASSGIKAVASSG